MLQISQKLLIDDNSNKGCLIQWKNGTFKEI